MQQKLLIFKSLIRSIRSSSVQFVLFGPIQSIMSTKVIFGSFGLILSTSVQFSPIINTLWLYSVHIGSILITMVLFGLCYPLWSYLVHFVHFSPIWSFCPLWFHSVNFGPIQSTLLLFGPVCPRQSYSVPFYPICILRSNLVPFNPVCSVQSYSVHLVHT